MPNNQTQLKIIYFVPLLLAIAFEFCMLSYGVFQLQILPHDIAIPGYILPCLIGLFMSGTYICAFHALVKNKGKRKVMLIIETLPLYLIFLCISLGVSSISVLYSQYANELDEKASSDITSAIQKTVLFDSAMQNNVKSQIKLAYDRAMAAKNGLDPSGQEGIGPYYEEWFKIYWELQPFGNQMESPQLIVKPEQDSSLNNKYDILNENINSISQKFITYKKFCQKAGITVVDGMSEITKQQEIIYNKYFEGSSGSLNKKRLVFNESYNNFAKLFSHQIKDINPFWWVALLIACVPHIAGFWILCSYNATFSTANEISVIKEEVKLGEAKLSLSNKFLKDITQYYENIKNSKIQKLLFDVFDKSVNETKNFFSFSKKQ